MSELKPFVVFCEQVRQEVDNKISMMGCFGKNMFHAGDYPAHFNLHALIHLNLTQEVVDKGSLEIRVGKEEPRTITFKNGPFTAVDDLARIIIDLTPAEFAADSTIGVFYRMEDEPWIFIGGLNITKVAAEELPKTSIGDADFDDVPVKKRTASKGTKAAKPKK